jgi:hypothetical protein
MFVGVLDLYDFKEAVFDHVTPGVKVTKSFHELVFSLALGSGELFVDELNLYGDEVGFRDLLLFGHGGWKLVDSTPEGGVKD